MRRIIPLATAALLALSACTITVEDNTQGKSEASRTPSESTTGPSDEQLAQFIRDEAPELKYVDTETILEATGAVCYALSTGATLKDILITAIPWGLDGKTVGVIVGGAVTYECPEYASIVASDIA